MTRAIIGFFIVWSACGRPAMLGPDAQIDPDAAPVDDPCEPTPLGPHWVEEGDSLAIEMSCQTGLQIAGDRFSFTGLPANASYDPVTGTLTFHPAIDQAAIYRVSVSVAMEHGPDEVRSMTIGVADAWNAPGNVPIADPQAYTHEFGLPVFFLSPAPQSETYTPATLYYRGTRYDIEAKLRGASSLSYPKRSYTLRFGTGVRFDEPDQDGGFVDKNRVVLTSTFDDNSYIRQRLAYELWSRLSPTIPVQAYSAVVYLDGEYFGLYTVSDFINDDLMEASGLAREGDVYKAINHNANFRLVDYQGMPKNTLHDGYEKTEGTPVQGQPGAFASMDELVSFVATSDDIQFAAEIGQRVELTDYMAWWHLATFSTASDSAGKNSYHYRDPAQVDGLFHVAPWDFNHSFGQAWTTHRVSATNLQTYEGRNYLFERLLADSGHGQVMRGQYALALTEGALAVGQVLATIDEYIAEIDRSARRDWGKWEGAYRSFGRWQDRTDFTSYEEEVSYVREWITEHHGSLMQVYF